MRNEVWLPGIATVALASFGHGEVANAQTTRSLVLAGELIPGVGTVVDVSEPSVDNRDGWMVEVDTNAPFESDALLMMNGNVVSREGDSVGSPAGATLRIHRTSEHNEFFEYVMLVDLAGTTFGSDDDQAVYFEDILVVQELDLLDTPEFNPGAFWTTLSVVRLSNERLVAVGGTVEDPVDGLVKTIAVYEVDFEGDITLDRIVRREGTVPPGQSEAVQELIIEEEAIAMDSLGRVMHVVDLEGDFDVDEVIYIDDDVAAQEGQDSPVPGRPLDRLEGPESVALSVGAFAYHASIEGAFADNRIVASNQGLVAQKGQEPSGLEGSTFFDFVGTLGIDVLGRTLWFAELDDVVTRVLMFDDTPLVVEGLTDPLGDGTVINDLSLEADVDAGGSTIVYIGAPSGGGTGAYLVEFIGSPPFAVDEPRPGAAGLSNRLIVRGAAQGETVALLAGRADGSSPTPCDGLTADVASANVVARLTADDVGSAFTDRLVPVGLAGEEVLLQAVNLDTCTKTAVVRHTFN